MTSWPEAFNLSTVSFNARETGGVGMTIPSCQSTAIFSVDFILVCLQGIGSIMGSRRHGEELTTVWA